MKKHLLTTLLFVFEIAVSAHQTQYATKLNVPYYSEALYKSDAYIKEQCVLDIYYPENIKGFATIIWFHGGGLTGDNKEIPEALKASPVIVNDQQRSHFQKWLLVRLGWVNPVSAMTCASRACSA